MNGGLLLAMVGGYLLLNRSAAGGSSFAASRDNTGGDVTGGTGIDTGGMILNFWGQPVQPKVGQYWIAQPDGSRRAVKAVGDTMYTAGGTVDVVDYWVYVDTNEQVPADQERRIVKQVF